MLPADLPAASGPITGGQTQRPGAAPQLEMSRSIADDLCGPSGARYGQLVCADIEATLATFGEGDCPEIRRRVAALKHKLREARITSADDRLLTNLALAVWQACASGVGGAGPGGGP